MLDFLKAIPDLIKTIVQHPIPTLLIALFASVVFNVILFFKPAAAQSATPNQTVQPTFVTEQAIGKQAASVAQAFMQSTVLPDVRKAENACKSNPDDKAAMIAYTAVLEKMFHFVEDVDKSVAARGWSSRPLKDDEVETFKRFLDDAW